MRNATGAYMDSDLSGVLRSRDCASPSRLQCTTMTSIQESYRAKRIYEITPGDEVVGLRLNDRVVELGKQEFEWYGKVAAWLPTVRGLADLSLELGMDEA